MWKTLLSNSSCPLVCVCECDLASLAPRWLSGKENAQGKWAKRWRWKILLIIVLNASPRSACVCTLKREFIAIVMRVHSRELHRGVSLMISKQKMKCEKKASTQFDAACNQIKYFIELRCEKQGELYSEYYGGRVKISICKWACGSSWEKMSNRVRHSARRPSRSYCALE